MNKFADMNFEEFKSKYLHLKYDTSKRALRTTLFDHGAVDLGKQLKSIDWSRKNAVTEVKEQGDVSLFLPHWLFYYLPHCS